MTTESMIDYDGLAQKAMRGVVRDVLKLTAENGLPGDHHFYISFDTQAPGVTLSKRLRERYPQEMTIVLQHRFWDLLIADDYFEIKLTFDTIPERLVVPFESIKVFFDPSVRYGLQFEEPEVEGQSLEQAMAAMEDDVRDQTTDPEPTKLPRTTRSSSPRKNRGKQNDDGAKPRDEDVDAAKDGAITAKASPEKLPVAKKAFDTSDKETSDKEADGTDNELVEADDDATGGAEIVSLDAFRKK
ncbi:MAG: SspB family protein [Hyphomicrobiaceae bacterium]